MPGDGQAPARISVSPQRPDETEEESRRRCPPLPFYTKSPELAALRQVVAENISHGFRFDDLKTLFLAIDRFCAGQFRTEDRGGWFSPKILGGARVQHVPPHIAFAVFAIYLHMASGEVDPVPFLSGPLSLNGITAISLDPSDRYAVSDREGQAHPMTDLMFAIPAITPREWILDTYGLPGFGEDIVVVGWHAAAQPRFTALATGQFLLHSATRRLLDPLGSLEEGDRFFTEPVNPSRLDRHRERLAEVFDTPLEVMKRNSDAVRRALEACLAVP